jgi:hypothetical protein
MQTCQKRGRPLSLSSGVRRVLIQRQEGTPSIEGKATSYYFCYRIYH